MMNPSDSLKDLESMLDNQQVQQEHEETKSEDQDSTSADPMVACQRQSPQSTVNSGTKDEELNAAPLAAANTTQLSAKELKKLAKEERRKAHMAAFEAAKRSGQVAPPKPKLSKSQRREQQQKQQKSKVQNNKNDVSNGVVEKVANASADKQSHIRPEVTPFSDSWNLFTHLPAYDEHAVLPRPDVRLHASIVRVALQMRSGLTTGANARCIAMLSAFKQVINDYETPPNSNLNRDLRVHIGNQMDFLNSCRAQNVSMLNAFSSLSFAVTNMPLSIPEAEAKVQLKEHIDRFILERIVGADEVIMSTAQQKIEDGDVVLVFARAQVLEKVILEAQRAKKRFRVIVADANPKLEGEKMLKLLVEKGVKCSYVLINAVSYVMKEVNKVFLGASAMLSNGAMLSRCGAAVVASMAHISRVPVIVLCETCKFSDKAQLDAITVNELGDPDELVNKHAKPMDWRSISTLRLLNLAYDLTPAEFVGMVITEIGCLPASAVPVALRELYRKHL